MHTCIAFNSCMHICILAFLHTFMLAYLHAWILAYLLICIPEYLNSCIHKVKNFSLNKISFFLKRPVEVLRLFQESFDVFCQIVCYLAELFRQIAFPFLGCYSKTIYGLYKLFRQVKLDLWLDVKIILGQNHCIPDGIKTFVIFN